MTKVIVFGGAGFLGSHVADLLSNNNFDVTIFDIQPSLYLQANQKMIVGSILDIDLVIDSIREKDIVYHFAGVADIEYARKNPIETVNSNILGTINILEGCRKFKIRRFIFASTIYVYSDHGSFYRSSKQACELLIENYFKEFNLNYTILRFGSLYGSRANKFNFIRSSLLQALIYGKIIREGDGEEIRDFINIIDASATAVKVLEDKYMNTNVMVTGTQTIKVKDLLIMIKEILNDEITIEYKPSKINRHYKITPYTFKPNVAIKIIPENHHDLGQGILACLYDIYQDLINDGKEPNFFKK